MYKYIFAIAVCISNISYASDSKAQNTRVGMISVPKILEGSHAFQKLRVILELQHKESEKKFADIHKELEKKNNALMSLQSTLPKKQWEERKRVFDAEVMDFQKQVQKRQQELQETNQRALVEIQGYVQDVLSKLSEKKGFSLVLDQQATIWFSKDVEDLTDEALSALNEKIKELKVSVASPEESCKK